MTAPLDFDAIEAEALGVSEELSARVEMKDPSLLSRFHPAERERAALFFRGARANTIRLCERIRELEASLTRETAARKSYEEGIAWETSCLHCASTLTSCREAEERAEAAEAIIAGRTVAPTEREFYVAWAWMHNDGFHRSRITSDFADVRHLHSGAWWPLDTDGRPCAWPVVAETAK